METKENRDGYVPAKLTAEEVNLKMRNRRVTFAQTFYGKDTPAAFIYADCDEIGWWVDWLILGEGSQLRLRFNESDIISMMEEGGAFRGISYYDLSLAFDMMVGAPEEVVIPSNNDEDKQEQREHNEPLIGKLVCVEWYGYNSLDGWISEADLREYTKPITCLTRGMVVEENSNAIAVAATIMSIGGNQYFQRYGGVQVVVRNAITHIEVLNTES